MKKSIILIIVSFFLMINLNSCDEKKQEESKTDESELKIEKGETKVTIDIDSSAFKIDKKEINDFKVTKEQTPATKEEISKMVSEEKAKDLNKQQKYVQEFFTFCSNKDYKNAAKFMIYRGKDKSRLGKDTFNPNNANELNVVKMTVDVIYSFLEESNNYKFMTFEETNRKEGVVYDVEVSFFKKGLGINRRYFEIIEIQNSLVISDMR